MTITENTYDAVKAILKGGANQTRAAEFLGISAMTVSRIARTETYADYVEHTRLDGGARYKKQEAVKQTVQIPWQAMQEMKKTNELLELISRKLAFIVDELTGMPTKGDEST